MTYINDYFYGKHTIGEIREMFQHQPDVDQVFVMKNNDDDYDIKDIITYFIGPNNSKNINDTKEFNRIRQIECGYADKLVDVLEFHLYKSGYGGMSNINVIVKDLSD